MKMDICLCSDDNYAKYTGTTIVSILYNKKQDEYITFHLLDGGMSQENKDKLLSLKNIKSCDMIFYDKKNVKYNYFDSHYLRLSIPSLMPNIDKILYLDSDMIITKSLRELFEIDIENYYAIAVEDTYLSRVISFKKMHGLDENDTYFNSGVLMINNKLLIKDNLEKMFYKDFLKYGNTGHADQDILNRILKGKVKFVDYRWNFLSHRKVYNNPPNINSINIIHYAGEKPWNKDSHKAFFIEEFWNYYQRTPFFIDKPLEAVDIMISQKIRDYEELKFRVNRIKFLGFYKNKNKFQIVLFFIRITIELNLNTIQKIAWWIPIKKLRDDFRTKILN